MPPKSKLLIFDMLVTRKKEMKKSRKINLMCVHCLNCYHLEKEQTDFTTGRGLFLYYLL